MINNVQPLISVIIPVYGVEKYISQCLESVINQTYKNIEVIVINDGTKDNSASIAKEYSKQDFRVKVYDFENSGLSAARNRGVSLAKGDYIAFLDSDDYVAPNMYEELINNALKTDADIVKCGYSEFIEDKIVNIRSFDVNAVIRNSKNGEKLAQMSQDSVLYIVVWNAIYKRNIALKVIYPEGYVNEDEYASPVYFFSARVLSIIREPLYFYRQNLDGLMRIEIPNKRPLDAMVCLALLHEYMCENGLTNSSLCTDLRTRIAKCVYNLIKTKKFRVVIELKFFKFMLRNLKFDRKIKLIYFYLRKMVKIIK